MEGMIKSDVKKRTKETKESKEKHFTVRKKGQYFHLKCKKKKNVRKNLSKVPELLKLQLTTECE